MQCQQCEKPATFHITELTGPEHQEIHLCEDHARQYLSESDADTAAPPSFTDALAQHLKVGQTAEDLARLDQQSCPVCGITFYEFRNQGRLGCPHDYECFEAELEPLIMNIHGAMEHTGKRPARTHAGGNPTDLIRKRREMQLAIDKEDYERASELRDEIRLLEDSLQGDTSSD
jgi:protein arginine kinase activator